MISGLSMTFFSKNDVSLIRVSVGESIMRKGYNMGGSML